MTIELEAEELEAINRHMARVIELNEIMNRANNEMATARRDLETAWKSAYRRYKLEAKKYNLEPPLFIDADGAGNVEITDGTATWKDEPEAKKTSSKVEKL